MALGHHQLKAFEWDTTPMTKSRAIRSQPFKIAREALIAAALRVALRARNDHVPDAGQIFPCQPNF